MGKVTIILECSEEEMNTRKISVDFEEYAVGVKAFYDSADELKKNAKSFNKKISEKMPVFILEK